MKHKLLINLLCLSLLLTMIPSVTYAESFSNSQPQKFTYNDEEHDTTIESTFYDENHIITVATIGNDSSVCEFIDNKYYLDGKLVDTEIVVGLAETFGVVENDSANIQVAAVPSTVKWGSWTTKTKTFDVHKVSAAGIATLISTYLFAQGLFVIPALTVVTGTVIASGYDTLKLVLKVRIGYDSTTHYNWAQQKYTFSGKKDGGSYKQIYTDTLTQKKPDK